MRHLLEFLELLGLLIAMSDFFGFSPKVQAWINSKRRGFFFWLDARGNEKIVNSNAFAGTVSLASAVLLVWFCYASYTHAANAPVRSPPGLWSGLPLASDGIVSGRGAQRVVVTEVIEGRCSYERWGLHHMRRDRIRGFGW
jgi:hypothetical protein